MGAAADVQKQTVRRIERHQRREAVAPVGDVLEHFGVRRHIGIEHPQVRTDGPRIGERQSRIEVEARRRVIEGIDDECVVLLGNDDARFVARLVARAFIRRGAAALKRALDAIDGQAWQPQAEDPPLVL